MSQDRSVNLLRMTPRRSPGPAGIPASTKCNEHLKYLNNPVSRQFVTEVTKCNLFDSCSWRRIFLFFVSLSTDFRSNVFQ